METTEVLDGFGVGLMGLGIASLGVITVILCGLALWEQCRGNKEKNQRKESQREDNEIFNGVSVEYFLDPDEEMAWKQRLSAW